MVWRVLTFRTMLNEATSMRKFVLCFKQEFGTPYSFEAFIRASRVRLKAVCLQDLGWGFELAGIYNCRRLFVVVGNTKSCTLRSCFWCAGRRAREWASGVAHGTETVYVAAASAKPSSGSRGAMRKSARTRTALCRQSCGLAQPPAVASTNSRLG